MNTRSILSTLTVIVISSSISALAMAKDGGKRGERVIDRLDADGDGQVSLEEFQPGRRSPFGEADANDDGVITLEEIEERMMARHERRESAKEDKMAMRKAKFTAHFNAMDTNGDGGLSKEEIKQGIFNRMDENQDGYISADEVKRPRGMGKRGGRGQHRGFE